MRHRRSVAIIGLGLIGGSLALALRRAGRHVTGADRSRAAVAAARRRRAVHAASTSIPDAIAEAGVIVLCVPPVAIEGVLAAVGRAAPRGAVVTDACSVKQAVVAAARRRLPDPGRFVGAHPMAGSERSGIGAAAADLFTGRPCVLTPVAGTRAGALRAVERLWRDAGARPVRMSPAAHDRATATASHLPHLLAFALAARARDRNVGRLAAGSFRDATRVARSDPAMWAGIFAGNRTGIRRALRAVVADAERLLRAPGPGGSALRSAAAALRGAGR